MPSTRRWYSLWTLALSLLLLAAGGPAVAEDAISPEDLVGTWTWQQSVGSVAGVTRTAAEEGDLVQIELSEDSKLRVTRNGVLREGTYELVDDHSGGQEIRLLLDDPFPRDEFPMLSLTMGISLSLDRLRLDEPCCDRWLHTFIFDAAGLVSVSRTSFGEVKDRWGDAGR